MRFSVLYFCAFERLAIPIRPISECSAVRELRDFISGSRLLLELDSFLIILVFLSSDGRDFSISGWSPVDKWYLAPYQTAVCLFLDFTSSVSPRRDSFLVFTIAGASPASIPL